MSDARGVRRDATPMFVIEDEAHAESQGEFDSSNAALTELRRRARIPWDEAPNAAPCTSWRTCGRKYEIVEFDTAQSPWREVRRARVLEISGDGVKWSEPFESGRTYESIPTLTKDEIVVALQRADPGELYIVVLAAALGIDDVEWAQGVCLSLESHPDPTVRGNAMLGLGHLARIHRRLDRGIVQPAILAALSDPDEYVRGQADAAADDVEHFLGWKLRPDTT